jgi:hypothetical protein
VVAEGRDELAVLGAPVPVSPSHPADRVSANGGRSGFGIHARRKSRYRYIEWVAIGHKRRFGRL